MKEQLVAYGIIIAILAVTEFTMVKMYDNYLKKMTAE